MKCNHTYKISGKKVSCQLESQIDNLPVDRSCVCIFHSKDIQWKKDNNFKEFLVKLFDYINNEKHTSFGFHDFVFTGEDINSEDIDSDFRVENILYFNKIFSRSTLTFYDCHFNCEVEIEQSVFKDALNFVNCKFEREITLNNCSFFNELNIFDNCQFSKKLGFYNMNTFRNNVQIVNSTFIEDLDIDNNIIHGTLHIDENKFSMDFGLYLFSNVFVNGFSLRNSINVGLLSIEENELYSDSLLSNLNKEASIGISNNKYFGEFKIQGTEDSLMFNPNTLFELESEHLEGTGSRIIFDYCDLLNLNEKALRTLTALEEEEKVVFNDTNKMTRLRIVHIVNNRDIPEYLLTDIFVLITRYFQHYFALQLSVSFQRLLTKNKTKIIFTSSQLITIEDFHQTFEECVKKMFKDKKNDASEKSLTVPDKYNDLDEQTENLKQRIENFYKINVLKPEDILHALILNEKIHIQINEVIMGDKNTFKKSQIGAVGSNSQSNNNSFQNINISEPKDLDFAQLLAELEKLKTELVSKAETPENFQAVADVANAEEAAKKKEGSNVISLLLKAGEWTLVTAKEIGVEVVANLISNHM